MVNTVIKTLTHDKSVRLYLMDNTAMLKDIMAINDSKSSSKNMLLAKAITGTALVSASLKDKQRISATFTMTNSKHKVYADADHVGNVRGYMNRALLDDTSDKETPSRDIIGTRGSIRVIKGFEMNQFTGITDMPFQNIDDDLSHYFKQSDQTDTVIKTAIKLDENNQVISGYGLYAQPLPNAPKNLLNEIKESVDLHNEFFNKLISHNNYAIEDYLSRFFNTAEVIGKSKVQFFCGCSKEMFYGILYSLEKKELETYIMSNTPLVSHCHVCGKGYEFNPSDLKSIL